MKLGNGFIRNLPFSRCGGFASGQGGNQGARPFQQRIGVSVCCGGQDRVLIAVVADDGLAVTRRCQAPPAPTFD